MTTSAPLCTVPDTCTVQYSTVQYSGTVQYRVPGTVSGTVSGTVQYCTVLYVDCTVVKSRTVTKTPLPQTAHPQRKKPYLTMQR
jgi:hypothetical protein